VNTPRPKVRRSRALGIPLTPKCVRYFERRPYPPGEHGRKRRTASDYSTRLLEKQRLRAQYDISETQLRRAFDRAKRSGTKTGEALVQDLEFRLDAVVLRAGFARTIYQARQAVTHHHVTVNGRRVDRPSYRVVPGDVVAIAERSRRKDPFLVAASGAHADAPRYLQVALADLVCRVERVPTREEVPVVCEEQLVVEYYSR
jgi:small subunit ribosomal protein S4